MVRHNLEGSIASELPLQAAAFTHVVAKDPAFHFNMSLAATAPRVTDHNRVARSLTFEQSYGPSDPELCKIYVNEEQLVIGNTKQYQYISREVELHTQQKSMVSTIEPSQPFNSPTVANRKRVVAAVADANVVPRPMGPPSSRDVGALSNGVAVGNYEQQKKQNSASYFSGKAAWEQDDQNDEECYDYDREFREDYSSSRSSDSDEDYLGLDDECPPLPTFPGMRIPAGKFAPGAQQKMPNGMPPNINVQYLGQPAAQTLSTSPTFLNQISSISAPSSPVKPKPSFYVGSPPRSNMPPPAPHYSSSTLGPNNGNVNTNPNASTSKPNTPFTSPIKAPPQSMSVPSSPHHNHHHYSYTAGMNGHANGVANKLFTPPAFATSFDWFSSTRPQMSHGFPQQQNQAQMYQQAHLQHLQQLQQQMQQVQQLQQQRQCYQAMHMMNNGQAQDQHYQYHGNDYRGMHQPAGAPGPNGFSYYQFAAPSRQQQLQQQMQQMQQLQQQHAEAKSGERPTMYRIPSAGSAPVIGTAPNNAFAHRFMQFAAEQQHSAASTAQQPAQAATPAAATTADGKAAHQRRCDLVESPTTKQNFKIFFRQFKLKEKQEGPQAAKDFACRYFDLLPEKIHWKIYLEMADLAKRENCVKEARLWYKKVNELQPYASQGWLEYAKMEEECGELARCEDILRTGLQYCPYNEGLMVKGIKHWERMGDLKMARSLLGRLKNVSVERAWRTIMEGGLLEARAGNVGIARKVFKYLMKNVPWYGPIYQEAFRFEEKCEEYERAIVIVEKGLRENPRYGPLWFSALRLYEKISNGNLEKTRQTVERAMRSISKELIWKIYFEASQIEERAGNLQQARAAYVQSIYHCPENLRWKVWLGGARMELNCESIETARSLLQRSLAEVPAKMKAMVLLECSRLEEYAGNLQEARSILARARQETKHEWKVFLESALLEMRANNIQGAIQEAKEALKIHTGTGRLWAVLIQLKQIEGEAEQIRVFQEALREVPKSGEVWCEGARIELSRGNLAEARKYLDFAIQFTPQYGDSFIEYLRLELTEGTSEESIRKLEQLCVNADPNYGAMWLHCKRHPLDSTRQVLRTARGLLVHTLSSTPADLKGVNANTIEMLSLQRMCHFPKNLSNEERRKIIFGSDQIKP